MSKHRSDRGGQEKWDAIPLSLSLSPSLSLSLFLFRFPSLFLLSSSLTLSISLSLYFYTYPHMLNVSRFYQNKGQHGKLSAGSVHHALGTGASREVNIAYCR